MPPKRASKRPSVSGLNITTVKEGRLLKLKGRDGRLPAVYQVKSHPKVPPSRRARRIFVLLQNTTPEAMERYNEYLAEMEFPEGTDEGVVAAGFLPIHPGDYVLLRSMMGDGDPMQDSLQLWVLPNDSIHEPVRKQWKNIRKHVGGKRKDRTPEKAQCVNGVWSGGARFEQHEQAVNTPRNLAGPTVGAKVPMGQDPTWHQRLRQEVVEAAARLAIAALEAGDEELVFALKLRAYVTNMPPVGFEGNYAFPTQQLNITNTQLADALALGAFKADLGNFGGKHKDENDSPGGVTCMITFSDLHPTDHAGYFIIGDLGIAVCQRGLVVTCFCGLRWHGGFPPTARPGKAPKKWSYRFVVVCYPPHAMLDGSAVVSFGALPGNKFFYMPPEFIDPAFDKTPVVTNIANWIHSGMYLTNPAGFLQYYYRALCQIAYHFNRQVPSKSQLQLDFKKLAECITLTDENGEVHKPAFWELHPGSDLTSTEFGVKRADCPELWEKHKAKQGQYIPHYVHLERVRQERAQKQQGKSLKRKPSSRNLQRNGPPSKKSKGHVTTQGSGSGGRKRKSGYEADDDADHAGGHQEHARKKSRTTATAASPPRSPHALRTRRAVAQSSVAPGQGRSRSSRKGPRLVPYVELTARPRKRRAPQDLRDGHWYTLQAAESDIYAELPHGRTPAILDYVCSRDSGTDGDDEESDGDIPGADTESSQQAVTPIDHYEPSVPAGQRLPSPLRDEQEDQLSDPLVDRSASPHRDLINHITPVVADPPPPFQKVLHIFSLSSLTNELQKYQKLAEVVQKGKHDQLQAEATIYTFMQAFDSDRGSPACVSALSNLWVAHAALQKKADLFGLQLAFYRRGIMLCSAAAWYWLTQYCPSRAEAFVARLLDTSAPDSPHETPEPTNWFESLCLQVYTDVLCRNRPTYDAGDFLPHLQGRGITGKLRIGRSREDDISSRVCGEVTRLLRDWLKFPNNTELVAAYLVIYVLGTFKNSDALLLDGVWTAYRTVHASVLGIRTKARCVNVSDLDAFASALGDLPLASPDSSEAALLSAISAAVEQCAPGVRQWTDRFIHSISPAPSASSSSTASGSASATAPQGDSPGSLAASGQIPLADPAEEPAEDGGDPEEDGEDDPDRNVAALPASPMCTQETGLRALVDFALEMLPLASLDNVENVKLSKLQRRVLSRPDFYLPWRELAPCRRHVTAPGGPFHPDTVNKPGAFTSMAMFRGLLFESPKILSKSTSGYFACKADWDAFVASQPEGKPVTEEQQARYFNPRCYGQPEHRRLQGMDYVSAYFDHESKWDELIAAHGGGPVPFETCYLWLRGLESNGVDARGRRRFKHISKLFLYGGLTSYLLAADLSYTSKVASPTIEELGHVVASNGLGSLKALWLTNQVPTGSKSVEEVTAGFFRVYEALYDALGSEENRALVHFDPIAVEHLLCKFSRTKAVNSRWKQLLKTPNAS